MAEKSNRLKQIVSDLFDLAKSTSGNIDMELESLDLKKLIEQTLADMSDEIEKSEIQIKAKFPDKPVNITADEILQRFNRGDKSRNTDGSGLGLSIAESFTNVCGGNFKVDVDGDLFKVTICFNLEN